MTFLIVHPLVRMTFLSIRQLVHTNSSIRPSLLPHEFCNTSACTHEFFDPSARTHGFVNPSSCTHDFSDPSARSHRSCDSSRVVFSTAFTVCASTKYTPLFLINGSCPSPNLKKEFFAKCVSTPCSRKQVTLKIGFVTFTTWKSYRFV